MGFRVARGLQHTTLMNEIWIYDPGYDDDQYADLRATHEEEQEEHRLIWAQLEQELIDRRPPHQLELFPEVL